MKAIQFLLPFLTISCTGPSTSELETALNSGSSVFQEVLNDPDHEVQIIYGQIDEGSIRHFYFNRNEVDFFYPASTVKMPVAFAALQKLQEMGLGIDTQAIIDSSEYNPRQLSYDSLFQGPITVRNLVTKIFAFSDNQAYNVLYGWLGKDYINGLNQEIGLESSRIVHQLSESAFSFSDQGNRNSYQGELIDGNDTIEFNSTQNSFDGSVSLNNQIKGEGYIRADSLIKEPFDFSSKNYISLNDLLGSLERVIKPEFFDTSERYTFSMEADTALAAIMKLRPVNLPHPISDLPDNYCKFFIYGDQGDDPYPDHMIINNKIGLAYGYLLDVAHIKDTKNNIEFFLAAVVHVNENKIYNDGDYEYDETGFAFLGELGRLIYEYEKRRTK